MSTTPIVQFGTSRFLQAHADLFISEALAYNAGVGPITVVQTSGNVSRRHRLNALAAKEGYPVHIKGVQGGILVDRISQVKSIKRALSTDGNIEELTRIICNEAEIVICNTADTGFRAQSSDGNLLFDQNMSFPAKLTHLLWARFKANGKPIQIMPTELVSDNGMVLRGLVLALAKPLSDEFAGWVATNITFVNSLVDRIVSEPLEPAGAVAEPYALWAIEACDGLIVPCTHPDVIIVPSLVPIATRKLFILNLGHTFLVSRWLARGKTGAVFVRDMMNNGKDRAELESVFETEVLPGFIAAGQEVDAKAYIATVLDRFLNPFLDHRLEDIAQNHQEKIDRRIAAFIAWVQTQGRAQEKNIVDVMPRLCSLVAQAENAANLVV